MKEYSFAIAVLLSASLSAARLEHIPVQVDLNEPFAVAFGRDGEWYICEHKGERIVKIDKSGKAQVVAGTGKTGYSGDGGPAATATFLDPHGIVINRNGKMYVADTLNHVVRLIDLKSGTVSTFAGTGMKGFGGDGGPASKALFNGTFAIALSPSGDRLIVTDLFNRRIRSIDVKTGVIRTVAGNGETGVPADGAIAVESPLVDPRAAAADSKGNIYVLERRGNALRVVDRSGKIRTVVAPGTVSPDLNGPKHLCVDKMDRVIVADAENHLIRRWDPKTGKLTTIAGTGTKGSRINSADPLDSELTRPHGVSIDRQGVLFISDSYNNRILKLSDY